jgi:hypothetical protein
MYEPEYCPMESNKLAAHIYKLKQSTVLMGFGEAGSLKYLRYYGKRALLDINVTFLDDVVNNNWRAKPLKSEEFFFITQIDNTDVTLPTKYTDYLNVTVEGNVLFISNCTFTHHFICLVQLTRISLKSQVIHTLARRSKHTGFNSSLKSQVIHTLAQRSKHTGFNSS